MDLFAAIRGRRSVRAYRRDPIPDGVLEDLIDAARWAPYGSGEAYPLRYVVIASAERRAAVRDLMGDPKWHAFISDAPAVVCVVRDTRIGGGSADAHAATENLLLAAYARGLGSCWLASFDPKRLRALLGMPEEVIPVSLVTLGYPDETPEAPPRPSVDRLIMCERWREG